MLYTLKIITLVHCTVLICSSFGVIGYQENNNDTINDSTTDREYIKNDVLIMPRSIQNSLSLPNYYETSEYLIGSISVGVLLLESNGLIDDNLEDWTSEEENQVTSEIQDSMDWWENQNLDADVSFNFDWNYKVPISYEPIIHPSAVTNDYYQQLWVSEALASKGYDTGDWAERAYSYVNDLRTDKNTDWAYAIFIIDSSEDADGAFTDGYFAYSYLGGPFLIMTYDNQRFGIDMMNNVLAHEMGHTFWATDEYNGRTEYSGYLNSPDVDGSGCVMDTADLCVSSGTALQIGWRDTDSDLILDIIDTHPITNLELIGNNLSGSYRFDFSGICIVQPYTNNNPYRADNDISINTIVNIQYRINEGDWIDIPPLDGNYDSDIENFEFTTEPLPKGIYNIEARAINSVANSDLNPAVIKISVETDNSAPLKPTKPKGPPSGKPNKNYEYSSSTNDPDGEDVLYLFDWGDGEDSGWIGPLQSGEEVTVSHIWLTEGNYVIKVKAKDINGFESEWSDPLVVTMPKYQDVEFSFINWFLQRFCEFFPLIRMIFSKGL